MATIRGNFKLTSSHKDDIADAAKSLLNRVVKLQESFFPLTAQEVLDGTTSSEDRAALAHLSANLYYINKSIGMNAYVGGEGILGIGNIHFYTNDGGFPSFVGNYAPKFNLDALLPDDRREVFVEWVSTTLRQFRIARVASKLTREFAMEHSGDSLASMRMRWPGIMAVPLSMPDPWPERARNLTTIQRSEYGWPDEQSLSYEWYLTNMDKLAIVDGLLAGGRFIESPQLTGRRITASVVDWKPGDGS